MITVPIYLRTDKEDNFERLGIDSEESKEVKITKLHLRNDQVVGFWPEPYEDENGRRDIVLYTPFDNFLCPWSEALENNLKDILSSKNLHTPWSTTFQPQ